MPRRSNPTSLPIEYLPLYVTPLESFHHPTPQDSRTGLYTMTALPPYRLDPGTPVQLLISPPAPSPYYPSLPPYVDVPSIQLPITGRIVGERSRTDCEVEFVVRSDDPASAVARAFVKLRFYPGTLTAPNLAELVAQRFYTPSEPEVEMFPRPQTRRGPMEAENGWLTAGATAQAPITLPPPRSDYALPTESAPALPFLEMDMRYARDPTRAQRTTTHPYQIWEAYGVPTTSRAEQAEAAAIQNYGQPIVVRTRVREDEQSRHLEKRRRGTDSVGSELGGAAGPSSWGPNRWT